MAARRWQCRPRAPTCAKSGFRFQTITTRGRTMRKTIGARLARAGAILATAAMLAGTAVSARAADEPELIFKRSTVWKFLTPDHKLATYAIDDPIAEGVSCHFTVPEKGRHFRLARRCGGSVRHLARLPAGGAGLLQGQVRAGRRDVPSAPFAVLQEDADRARLRRQAQRAGLCRLFRQARGGIAEEFPRPPCRSCPGATRCRRNAAIISKSETAPAAGRARGWLHRGFAKDHGDRS